MVNGPDDLIRMPEKEIDPKLKRAQSIVGTSAGRPENDFYPTPPEATLALLSKEKFSGSVWEPACGDGAISKVMETEGYTVKSSDLIDRGYGVAPHDFLASDWTADNIVTNPPFTLAQEFVLKSLEATKHKPGGKVVMLCKLVFLEGQKRKSFFESTPLARVHVFSKRVQFYREGHQGKLGTSMMAFAWFVWEHGHEGPPTISWL
jgi:hypothetical protein